MTITDLKDKAKHFVKSLGGRSGQTVQEERDNSGAEASTGWKSIPIKHPLSAPWRIPLRGPDLLKLLKGFRPVHMEDKWRVDAQGPDEQGNLSISMCRSWTGHEIVVLNGRLYKRKDGSVGDAKDGGEIYKIVWDMGEGPDIRTEEDAKDTAERVCEMFFGCELKASK
ncbi:hypothetical protein ACJ41O_005966 [Fusarium nematophilum]